MPTRLPVPLTPPTRCQSPGPPHFPSPHGKPQFPGTSPVCDTNQAPTPEQSRGPTVRLTRFQPSLGPDSWGLSEPQFPYLLNGRPSSPDPSGLPGGLCNEGRCEVRGQDHRLQAMWPAVDAHALYMRQVPSLHVQPSRRTHTRARRHRAGTPSGPAQTQGHTDQRILAVARPAPQGDTPTAGRGAAGHTPAPPRPLTPCSQPRRWRPHLGMLCGRMGGAGVAVLSGSRLKRRAPGARGRSRAARPPGETEARPGARHTEDLGAATSRRGPDAGRPGARGPGREEGRGALPPWRGGSQGLKIAQSGYSSPQLAPCPPLSLSLRLSLRLSLSSAPPPALATPLRSRPGGWGSAGVPRPPGRRRGLCGRGARGTPGRGGRGGVACGGSALSESPAAPTPAMGWARHYSPSGRPPAQ